MDKVKLFDNQVGLKCENCSKDLFKEVNSSIVVLIEDRDKKSYVDIYACCKGSCDDKLKTTRLKENHTDSWIDLGDFVNPVLYLKQVMSFINNLQSGIVFTDNVVEGYKNILLETAPYVMREASDEEKNIATTLLNLPF